MLPFSVIVILLGAPGSGKGTHAAPLAEELGIPHISTGDLFRAHIRDATSLGKQAKLYIDKGDLVPDRFVMTMLEERIQKPDCKGGYLLDGYPRTLAQAEDLFAKIKPDEKLSVFYLAVSDETVVKRITGRQGCPQCKKIYHRMFAPSCLQDFCETCRIPLTRRQDDEEVTVRKRLVHYHREAAPLLRFFEEKGELITLDGEDSPSAIFQKLVDHFEKAMSVINK